MPGPSGPGILNIICPVLEEGEEESMFWGPAFRLRKILEVSTTQSTFRQQREPNGHFIRLTAFQGFLRKAGK